MKTERKGVDIVIPAYQVEKYLAECLESAVNQTYTNIHIIVVDDGSFDKSGKIADDYAKKYSNITVIHQENKGLSGARNSGLLLCDQEYVYFLDSDDYIELTAIEKLVNTIEEEKADFVFMERRGFVTSCDNNGDQQEVKLNHCKSKYPVRNGKEQFCKLIKNDEYRSCVPYIFFKREYLLKNNLCFKEGILHEDELFSFLVFEANGLAAHCFEPLYHLRRRPDSIMTSKTTVRNFDSMLTVYYELLDMFLGNIISGESARLGLIRIAYTVYGKYYSLSDEEKETRKNEMQMFNKSVFSNNGFGNKTLKTKCAGPLYKYFTRGIAKLNRVISKNFSSDM